MCDCSWSDCETPAHANPCREQHPGVCGRCGSRIEVPVRPMVEGRSRHGNKAALVSLTCGHPSLVLAEVSGVVRVVCGGCFYMKPGVVLCPACSHPATTARGEIGLCDLHAKVDPWVLEGMIRRHQATLNIVE